MAENVTAEEIAELIEFCRGELAARLPDCLEEGETTGPHVEYLAPAKRALAIAEKLPALLEARETLKAPEPSDAALIRATEEAFSAKTPVLLDRSKRALKTAYAIDVAPLIAERDRLAGEVANLKLAVGAGDNEIKRLADALGSDSDSEEMIREIRRLQSEESAVAADVERLTKERDELRQWHADVEKLYRDADARVKVLYERCEALENARIPSVIESAILHDRNRVAKHDLARLTRQNAAMREALESLLPAARAWEFAETRTYCYGDGRTEPFEWGLDIQFQQTRDAMPADQFATAVEGFHAEADEEEADLPSRRARAALAQLDAPPAEEAPPIMIDYTNWRGERRNRNIIPLRPFFGSNEWHKEPQWLLEAIDPEDGKVKMFAFAGIHGFGPLSDACKTIAEAVGIAESASATLYAVRDIEPNSATRMMIDSSMADIRAFVEKHGGAK